MEIRKYVSGNELDILNLFHLVFNKEMTLEAWNWRFKNNPFTKDVFIYLMWEGEQLIGHYAVSPVEMKLQGKVIKTALSMTTMTHPDHGGKGIFSKLAANLYKDLKEEFGYKFIWGFPNNNSHYGFIKNLGWQDIAVIPMLSGKISELRLKKEEKVPFNLGGNFDDNTVVKINNSGKDIKINKTQAYLEWRYTNNPTANYKILQLENGNGTAVYKVINSFEEDGGYEIDLMELSFEDDINILNRLLNSIINNEPDIKLIQFNIWKSIFSSNRILLEKLGFKITQPLTYLGYLDFDNSKLISHYQNWEIGLGYSDVF